MFEITLTRPQGHGTCPSESPCSPTHRAATAVFAAAWGFPASVPKQAGPVEGGTVTRGCEHFTLGAGKKGEPGAESFTVFQRWVSFMVLGKIPTHSVLKNGCFDSSFKKCCIY